MTKPIRVVCVDDSALMRKLLSSILDRDPGIEVVGTAPDPLVARERIKKLDPDVITLDVEMPKMDGISFLEKLMRLRPTPVVMVSTLTEKGAQVSLRALELGAVDVVAKPKENLGDTLPEVAEELITKVKTAALAKIRPLRAPPPARTRSAPDRAEGSASGRATRVPVRPPTRSSDRSGSPGSVAEVVAVGSSTGGTEAVRVMLTDFPTDGPPVVIAQHIPASFSAPFAARLNQNTPLRVVEAEEGQLLRSGYAYVAPGDHHLRVKRGARGLVACLDRSEKVNRHRPSCDVLLDSVAEAAGSRALGIILTGMGDDGARGLLAMRRAGASTVAQDEATSVVWGMPGAAVKLGAAAEVLPLERIAAWVFEPERRLRASR